MAGISFSDFTAIAFKCIEATGFEMLPSKQPEWKILLKEIYFAVVMVNIFLSLLSLIGFMIEHSNDSEVLLAILPNLTNAPFITFKMCMLLVHKDELVEVLLALKEIFPQSLQDASTVKSYLKALKGFRMFYGGFMILVYISAVSRAFTLNYGADEYVLPVEMLVPIAYENSAIIFLAYNIWIYWISFNVMIASFGMDLLLFGVVSLMSLKFDQLKAEIENFGSGAEPDMTSVKEIVAKHEDLLTLNAKLENVYASSFLYNWVQSSALLCFILRQLATSHDASNIGLFVAYLVTSFIQIGLVCFLGQKLIESSAALADAAYNCDWLKFKDTKARNSILMIMLKSQKPAALTAKRFRIVSLESLTSVGKNIFNLDSKVFEIEKSDFSFTDPGNCLLLLHFDPARVQ